MSDETRPDPVNGCKRCGFRKCPKAYGEAPQRCRGGGHGYNHLCLIHGADPLDDSRTCAKYRRICAEEPLWCMSRPIVDWRETAARLVEEQRKWTTAITLVAMAADGGSDDETPERLPSLVARRVDAADEKVRAKAMEAAARVWLGCVDDDSPIEEAHMVVAWLASGKPGTGHAAALVLEVLRAFEIVK